MIQSCAETFICTFCEKSFKSLNTLLCIYKISRRNYKLDGFSVKILRSICVISFVRLALVKKNENLSIFPYHLKIIFYIKLLFIFNYNYN